MMINLRSLKTQVIIFLFCFAVFIGVKDKELFFLFKVIIAAAAAVAIEALVIFLKTKKSRVTESAIITGMISGYVLSSREQWWVLIFAAAAAIIIKHIARFQNRHIFNPAALGLFIVVMFLGASTQWKGTYLWYILLPAGLYFAIKIRKLEIIIGYAVSFLMIYGIQGVAQKTPLYGIFDYLSYFYIFIMVIEPKTSPAGPLAKFLFGSAAAVFVFILNGVQGKISVELLSLLAINAAVPLLNKIPLKKTASVPRQS